MKNKGFSLVELIVVIAIMAILVGVAVPVYTSYIEKANKSKDIQMVDEVAHALQVYAAGNHEIAADDYVVLTTGGASALEGGFAEAAMKATFGENWEDELALEYDKWTDSGVLAQVLEQADYAEYVASSTYLTESTPAELMTTVSAVTGALAHQAVTAGQDPLGTMEGLGLITEDQYNIISAELVELGVSYTGDKDAYGNALANVLMKELSKDADVVMAGEDPSVLYGYASDYAALYAWASVSEEGADVLQNMNDAILDPDATSATIIAAFDSFKTNYVDDADSNFNQYNCGEKGETDQAAFALIMSTVSDLSQNYDMKTSGVFSSDAAAKQLNDYVDAVVAVAAMEDDQITALTSLAPGSVVVFVTAKGTVSVVPNELLGDN